jgi:Tol biopolymer transport system component
VPADGGDEQKITSGKGMEEIPFDWSADGQSILVCDKSGIFRLPLAAAPRAEEAKHEITSDLAGRRLFDSKLSPDERWVAFLATGNGTHGIYVVSASGGEWVRITEDGERADKPRWSPDGKTIFYMSNRGTGFFNVWGRRFDPAAGMPVGEPFRVTSFDSPDRIVWASGNAGVSFGGDRLVLPLVQATGTVWVLENVDR